MVMGAPFALLSLPPLGVGADRRLLLTLILSGHDGLPIIELLKGDRAHSRPPAVVKQETRV